MFPAGAEQPCGHELEQAITPGSSQKGPWRVSESIRAGWERGAELGLVPKGFREPWLESRWGSQESGVMAQLCCCPGHPCSHALVALADSLDVGHLSAFCCPRHARGLPASAAEPLQPPVLLLGGFRWQQGFLSLRLPHSPATDVGAQPSWPWAASKRVGNALPPGAFPLFLLFSFLPVSFPPLFCAGSAVPSAYSSQDGVS